MYASRSSQTGNSDTTLTRWSTLVGQNRLRCIALVAFGWNLAAIASAVEIVPPDASFAGKTYSGWLEDWWQWTASIPGDESSSPFNDVTGALANVNQSGPVFFLSKSWQYNNLPLIDGERPPAEERSAIVPAGSAIFVPFDGIVRLETSGRGFDTAAVADDNFNVLLNEWSPFVAGLVVDGKEIPIDTSLASDQYSPYLIPTPIFSIDFPEESSMLAAFGDEGTEGRTLLAQSWEFMAILEPLPVGKHTINVFGADGIGTDFEWQTNVSWSIDVAYRGDANLDGEFNASDLVAVFEAGKYETGETADWSQGDWTGDQIFDSSDIIAALRDGGYSASTPATVPEPSTAILLPLGLLALVSARKTRRAGLA